MSLELYRNLLPKVEKNLIIAKSNRDFLIKEKEKHEDIIEQLKKESELILTEKEFIKEVCEKGRTESGSFLENLVTNSLQFILGDNYGVKINFNEKGATPTAEVLVKTIINGYETLVDPSSEDGGGIADIVSLILQSLFIIFTNPDSKTPIILDEPTKFVSAGIYAENTAKFLSDLAETYEKQIIMVTHDTSLIRESNNPFRVYINGEGSSTVEQIYNN